MSCSSLKVHKKYDLKGSTVDREASQKEREKDHPTFKDNDFLNDGVKIHIGEEAKEKLLKTLRVNKLSFRIHHTTGQLPHGRLDLKRLLKRIESYANDALLSLSQWSETNPIRPPQR